ncbi:HvfC/BufC N-terminal domain-containing protein [Hufsiella ginkgonis]|uniref:Putative DNA-binding domain-containing protein n=1 Tax=Hufsiella ginkgonis TaxID=2695274 RepID=A0A7K1XT01_9SPHI|nr:DNA-binding domain-containing protein [Hufsiella ginkgonis]MXV13889.1 hypothetical protein [Hufsiella ginkgonis]
MNDETQILQCWLGEIILAPGNLDQKLESVRARYQVHEQQVVVGSRGIPAYSRLHVYTSGYVARLKECLSADFPILKKFLGDEVFDRFVSATLMFSPSRSYSLYDLGLNFLRFLENTRPRRTDMSPEQQVLLELPLAIARVERARQEVQRAPGTEKIPLPLISAADLMFQDAGLKLVLPASVKVFQLNFTLKDMLVKLQNDQPFELPAAQTSYMAVVRADYRLYLHELEAWQFHFLTATEHHVNFYEAARDTAAKVQRPSGELLADLWIWLSIAVAQRLLIVQGL